MAGEVDGVQKKRVKRIKKVAHPDTGALAFALKNLAPDKWRDRQELDQSGDLVINIEKQTDFIEQYLNGEEDEG